MFTGIIEGLGTITKIRPSGQGKRFTIEADYSLDQTKTGDSIAVSGACLTYRRPPCFRTYRWNGLGKKHKDIRECHNIYV